MNKQSSALLNTAEIEENPQSGYVTVMMGNGEVQIQFKFNWKPTSDMRAFDRDQCDDHL